MRARAATKVPWAQMGPAAAFDEKRRREVVVAALAGVLVLAILAPSHKETRATATRHHQRPNVVAVLTDDQDARSLSVMGAVRRQLAMPGVTFENSFVTYSLCCPSRITFLTGRYAHNHRVLANNPPHGGYPAFRRKVSASRTLPVYLHRAGYRTAYVGKFLNFYGVSHPRQVPKGWDQWRVMTGGTEHQMYGYTLNSNGHLHTYGSRPSDYQTDVLAHRADHFLRHSARHRRPFFLTFAPGAPHDEPDFLFRPSPHRNPRPAPRDLNRFDHRRLPRPPSFNEARIGDKPPFLRDHRLHGNDIRRLTHLYRSRLESLLAVDNSVSRLIQTLRRTGELDNTVVIFTSDNGYLLGEHRQTGKELPYEESMRVPLIVRGPGFPGGVRRRQLVANIDLAPTIAALAHAPGRRHMDGISLLPLARHRARARRRDLLFERSHLEGRSFAAVRTQRYVLIRWDGGGRELYDLRRDPYELHNRARSHAYSRVRHALLPRLRALSHCKRKGCRVGGQ
jgi:N-acetylglucosamine-6-sulfatase